MKILANGRRRFVGGAVEQVLGLRPEQRFEAVVAVRLAVGTEKNIPVAGHLVGPDLPPAGGHDEAAGIQGLDRVDGIRLELNHVPGKGLLA